MFFLSNFVVLIFGFFFLFTVSSLKKIKQIIKAAASRLIDRGSIVFIKSMIWGL